MQQPKIRDDLFHKLQRIATAYEMSATTMLDHIVAVALDELDGKQDDYTVCIPVQPEAPHRKEGMPRLSAPASALAGLSPATPADRSSRSGTVMAWFVIETERKTWTKYLIEAADEADAYEKAEAWEYRGYLDGQDETSRTYGPFASRDAALDDIASSVDGR